LIVGHLPTFWIYHHWALVLDPTKLIRLGRSSTVMIDGDYCGTDKLAHFFHMGYLYFSAYRKARSAGNDEAESEVRAVRLGINSEDSFLGIFTTGVRSNADLAANYMGYLFYRNLTEDVRVNELVRPPLLIREGPYWRINVHVRPNSDFFSVFVSPHWDEALNPNTYAPGMDRWIRQEIRRRCPDLLAWYRDGQGRPRRRGDFLRIMEELATVDGKDYGHQGVPAALVSIANTCFGEAGESSEMVAVARAANREPAAEGADPRGADAFGRTELWHAAAGGDAERVRRCLADGADAGAADLDGETPLHVASRWGHQEIVELLGRRGAPLDARALYGVTPLHLAVRELRIGTVRTLLTLGADARARDIFGCTPLHDAASRGFDAVAILLRSGGADPDAEDVHAATPLHAAARNGRVNMVELLLEWGADAGRKDARGRSAVELLKAAGHKEWGGLRRGRDEEAR
jgi:ankyrin repeat protein